MNKECYQVGLIGNFLQDTRAHARNTSKQPLRNKGGTPSKQTPWDSWGWAA